MYGYKGWRLHRSYPHTLYAIKKDSLNETDGRIKIPFIQMAKNKRKRLRKIYWQDGYGAFSVNPAEVDTVIRYITNQHKHHSKKIFQDEFRAILNKNKIDFDERYVWD